MSAPAALPPLGDVIRRHGLSAVKALGQHFLLDMNLTRRIARAAGELSGASAIEIGPGPGGLTRALLETPAARVVAIERDRRAVAALAELAAHYPGRLTVIEADALEVDPAGLAPAPRHIVANLPYNVATPLLAGWLKRASDYAAMTLMFQKEVARRIAAGPRAPDYGRLSVLAQWACETKLLFDVSPKAFTPPPKVTSSLVRLVPRAEPEAADVASLERVTRAAFGQRRKMLRQSLKSLGRDPAALLAAAGIRPEARAEELDVAQFCALARALD
ncbi:MAG: 16S rRNA (adenine(1518)-N(6)/adenine(1519)-N(6))-dimethyltransferase RsmA [Rhodospirillales bacterium]